MDGIKQLATNKTNRNKEPLEPQKTVTLRAKDSVTIIVDSVEPMGLKESGEAMITIEL